MPFLKKHIKPQPLLISILIILIGSFAYFTGIPFLDLMELKTVDLRFEARERISPNPGIVLAVIDEKSIAKEGKWIWPRSKLADLVTKLSKAGASVIAFDIGFLEPDDKRVVQAIENIESAVENFDIQDKGIENYLKKLKAQADNDKLLANAIANSSASVVLGYFFQMDPESSEHLNEKDISIHQENITGSRYSMERYTSDDARNVPLIEVLTPQSNIELISNATSYSGFFNMYPDQDGVVRWMPAVLKFKESLYAPLSLMTISALLNIPLSVKVAEYGVEEVRIGGLSIPTDELGRILINYRGKEKTFPHIPVTDILNEDIPGSLLKDKIVIVGATAVGIYDLRVTPFGSVFPGLEIHANIVDSILSEDFMYQPAWASIFDITAIIVTGLFLGIVLSRAGVISGAATGSSLFIGYILLCQYLFSEKGWILNLVYPLSVMILVYVGITAYRYLTESRQKRFIKDAFSTYLAPTVVKQLIESPETLELGGEEREITAF
ncbi:MAG: guanylate cyclase, partial [Desulfuromonadales bacterium C00003093]